MSTPAFDLRDRLAATLGERYLIGHELGAGGMARVYAATEAATGRRVAVKVLAPAVAACCDTDRFRSEMAIVASLEHPHIVRLLAECEECGGDRLFYFVMPFIEGETLRERVDREGVLPVPEVVRLLWQIASALADGLTRAGFTVGTPAYTCSLVDATATAAMHPGSVTRRCVRSPDNVPGSHGSRPYAAAPWSPLAQAHSVQHRVQGVAGRAVDRDEDDPGVHSGAPAAGLGCRGRRPAP